jgi:hypothetical protein
LLLNPASPPFWYCVEEMPPFMFCAEEDRRA